MNDAELSLCHRYYRKDKTMKRSELVPGKIYRYGDINKEDYLYIGVDEFNSPIFKNLKTKEIFHFYWYEGAPWKEKEPPLEGWLNVYRGYTGVHLTVGSLYTSRERAVERSRTSDRLLATVHLRYENGKLEIVND